MIDTFQSELDFDFLINKKVCYTFQITSNKVRGIRIIIACTKGQLISKCPFGIIVWTKYQRNYFWISALNFFVASWGLPGSFLGLPVGFLAYDITY